MTTRQAAAPISRRLLSIDDLSDEDVFSIVARGVEFSRDPRPSTRPLDGDVVGVCFEQTSTRTRTAFSSGALRLGAHLISYGPGDLQTNTGETLGDTGRVLAGMLDVLVVRTPQGASRLAELAGDSTLRLVNAMNADEHPTQALTDLTTLLCHFGRIDGLRVLYLGEANSTATALALALTRFTGVTAQFRTPAGYSLPESYLKTATEQSRRHDGEFVERHDMDELPSDFDVIYTTRWQTTGTSKKTENWREEFAPFAVHAGLWARSPNAVFMHDLPAHRGEEVTAEVLDGPASIAFPQAEHKLHSAMAVLQWCRAKRTRS